MMLENHQTTIRFAIIAAIVMAMLVPLMLVRGVVSDRQYHQRVATENIADAWGSQQHVTGPFLVVPERMPNADFHPDGSVSAERDWVFLPEELRIEVNVEHEWRRRSIFEVPVYTATFRVSGSFPDLGDVLEEGGEEAEDRPAAQRKERRH